MKSFWTVMFIVFMIMQAVCSVSLMFITSEDIRENVLNAWRICLGIAAYAKIMENLEGANEKLDKIQEFINKIDTDTNNESGSE